MVIVARKIVKWVSLVMAGVFFLFILYEIPPVQKLRYPMPYKTIVQQQASHFGVDPLLVTAVIREESKFMPKSESSAGARGVMQLMPETAEWAAEKLGLKSYSTDQLYEPQTNIMLGSWYLSNLSKQFNNNLVLVLAAYNGGRGRVQEWLDKGEIGPQGRIDKIPIRETREYVKKVLDSYGKYKELYPKINP